MNNLYYNKYLKYKKKYLNLQIGSSSDDAKKYMAILNALLKATSLNKKRGKFFDQKSKTKILKKNKPHNLHSVNKSLSEDPYTQHNITLEDSGIINEKLQNDKESENLDLINQNPLNNEENIPKLCNLSSNNILIRIEYNVKYPESIPIYNTNYFLQELINTKHLIIYLKNNLNEIVLFINNIIDYVCNNDYHIFIFINIDKIQDEDNDTIKMFYNALNNMLVAFKQIYQNVSIINYFTNGQYIIPEIYFKRLKIIRNIINIPYSRYILNIYIKNNNIHIINNKIKQNSIYWEKNNQLYVVKYMEHYYANIYEWVSKYISINKKCSYKKLLQSSGTCWVNSVLNLLILSKDINIEFINNISTDNIIEIDKFNYDKKFNTMLFSLFNHILINNHPINTQHDIANILGYTFKCLINSSICNSISKNGNSISKKGGNGGSSFILLYKLFEILKLNFLTICHNETDGKLNILEISNIEIENENSSFKWASIMRPNNIQTTFYIYYATSPYNKYTYNISGYKLIGCIININNTKFTHSICGFICDNKRYIYDSNNYFIESSWILEEIKKNEYFKTYKFIDVIYKILLYKKI